jgi:hypothetical protein
MTAGQHRTNCEHTTTMQRGGLVTDNRHGQVPATPELDSHSDASSLANSPTMIAPPGLIFAGEQQVFSSSRGSERSIGERAM